MSTLMRSLRLRVAPCAQKSICLVCLSFWMAHDENTYANNPQKTLTQIQKLTKRTEMHKYTKQDHENVRNVSSTDGRGRELACGVA